MVNRKSPPFSKDRCDQIESGKLTDYGTNTDVQLKEEMRRRGLELRGRRKTVHYIKATQASDERDFERYQERKDRNDFDKKLTYKWEIPLHQDPWEEYERHAEFQSLLDARPDRMFASNYKEDTSRKTFLDLPREIRNMIYEWALFDPGNCSIRKLNFLRDKRQLLMWSREFHKWDYHDELTIATLRLLGATNKQIRREARALFWAKLNPGWLVPMHHSMTPYIRCS